MMNNTTIDNLRRQATISVTDLAVGDHDLRFEFADRSIHCRLRIAGHAPNLVIGFHGAVDPRVRNPPIFVGFFGSLREKAHQLSIADPLVDGDISCSLTWYAGSATFNTQAIVSAISQGVSEGLKVKRTIYFGASGGGFAALYFSHRHPGSFAVVGNPQTRITKYFKAAILRYMQGCWPSLEAPDQLSTVTCDDLVKLYSRGFDNTVIYVQSAGDRTHTENQLLPFAGAVARTFDRKRFILQSDFWGQMGHVNVAPTCLEWIHAICDSKTETLEALLMSRHAYKTRSASTKLASTATTAGARTARARIASPTDGQPLGAGAGLGKRLQAWRATQGVTK